MKKLFYIIILLTPFLCFSKDKKATPVILPPEMKEFSLDFKENITDTENDSLSRIDDAILNGDYNKAIDNSKMLLKTLLGEDKQVTVISLSLLLVEILIQQDNFETALKILDDCSYKIKNSITTDSVTVKAWETRINTYLLWIKAHKILNSNNGGDINPVLKNLMTVRQVAIQDKANYSLMLIDNCIGILLNVNSRSIDSLDYVYESLKIANDLNNVWFYYKNSASIIDAYIKQKSFDKALNRLYMLNILFTQKKPSSFYKIKVLVLYARILYAQNKVDQANAILKRAYEVTISNDFLANEAKKELLGRIQTLSMEFTPSLQSKKKSLFSNSNNSFLLNYIQTSN